MGSTKPMNIYIGVGVSNNLPREKNSNANVKI